MNILICHERFLFRFGADRALILLGKGLKELGHSITVMANRYEPEIIGSLASAVIDCPTEGAAYLDLNEFTSDWLRDNWTRLFAPGAIPDAIIVGGWPFISAISFFREVCENVIFVDFGVVPTDGYSEGTRITLDKLRTLRRQHLQNASRIVSISRFIADSQSRPDSFSAVPTHSILLGADHMEAAVWPAAQLKVHSARGSTLNAVRSLKLQGKKVLLCLGRWEPGCYKNSEAALDFMNAVRKIHPDSALVVLEEASDFGVPAHLNDAIVPIGFPDDYELTQIMKLADAGISFSLWEGFNLPLAEMQWLGRPAFALDVGAHREVIAHRWYLCQNTGELASKTADLLAGKGVGWIESVESLKAFRAYFRWARFIKEFSAVLQGISPEETKTPSSRRLLIDVTNSTRDPANSGVVRVTRRLGRALQEFGDEPVFVVWEEITSRYVLPTRSEYELLGQFNGPVLASLDRCFSAPEQRISADEILAGFEDSECWLLLPEVKMESSFQSIRRYARDRNLKIAAVFYDSIPVLRPDLCNEEVRNNHAHYMLGLSECDLALPISNFSAKCLEDFWRDSGIVTSCRVVPDVLPGEFAGGHRSARLQETESKGIQILCVSTLEPRKNHRNLIQACLSIEENYPDLDWSLTLVGNRYAGAFEIADWVQSISAENSRIKWLGIVDDATLEELYQECAFTVYPSVIEGFGLPILESIWHGRPCICSNQGVMSELADGGGCLTTDVTDPLRLADAIYSLATDEDLRLKLSREAASRSLKTWNDYVAELTEAIAKPQFSPAVSEPTAPSVAVSRDGSSAMAWQNALYPGCLCEKWQMNDSERIALTGLLARHTPHCSIEVGTYFGGSLSLISQYSEMVFSIDVDDTLRSRFTFPNVTFLTGRSTEILPHLLHELDRAHIPLEFMLIDGDHTANGVKSDIACLLTYIPKKPLFVVLHDSFNPECRRGMLEAGWNTSPYCHWVDLDFVPGRIVEHHGPSHGELWGGLAAAYFLPVTRNGELQIGQTANQMFQALAGRKAASTVAGL